MKIHLVKKGETLFNIAKKYGIELQKLITFNSQIADPDQIDVGMKVKIPSTPVPVPPPVGHVLHKHIVVQGDSLWKLSKAWDVPLKAVIDANPHLKNPNVLMTGEIVYIPNLAAGTAPDHTEGMSKAELTAPIAAPEAMEAMPEMHAMPMPAVEEPIEWPGMPDVSEAAEHMPQPVFEAQEPVQFPFAQYEMPATEAMIPQAQPAPMAMQPIAEGMGQPMPFAPAPVATWGYESFMQFHHKHPHHHEAAVPYMHMMPMAPAAQMPVMGAGDKYPGIPDQAAPCPPVMEWPEVAVQSQQAMPYPQMTGGPCGCHGGGHHHAAVPFGMHFGMPYGMPYAMPGVMPGAVSPQQTMSPHASWMKKDDCGCDERMGDIGLDSIPREQETRTDKAAPSPSKASVSTKTRAPKRKSPAKREKRQNHPWIKG